MPHPLNQAAHTLSLSLPTTHLASLTPALYSSAVIATTATTLKTSFTSTPIQIQLTACSTTHLPTNEQKSQSAGGRRTSSSQPSSK